MRFVFILLITLLTHLGFGQCQWDRFSAATDEATPEGRAFTDAIEANPSMVDAWEVMDNAGMYNLATRIDDIRFVDDYLKSNPGKTGEQVSADIKNKGWQKWVDDLAKGGENLRNTIKYVDNYSVTSTGKIAEIIDKNGDVIGTLYKQKQFATSTKLQYSYKYKLQQEILKHKILLAS